MLQRINHTITAKIPLLNGYMRVSLRHNVAHTDLWSENIEILCWIYKGDDDLDNDRIAIIRFHDYKQFKIFKDHIKLK